MKTLIAVAVGIAFAAGQTGIASADVVAKAGSPAACSAQWTSMVANGSVGHQKRASFMRQCMVGAKTVGTRAYQTEGYHLNGTALLIGAGAVGIIATAAVMSADNGNNSVSP